MGLVCVLTQMLIFYAYIYGWCQQRNPWPLTEKQCSGSCIRGHRASSCEHYDRYMVRVKKPGRPLTACPHVKVGCQCTQEEVVMVRVFKDGQCFCKRALNASASGRYPLQDQRAAPPSNGQSSGPSRQSEPTAQSLLPQVTRSTGPDRIPDEQPRLYDRPPQAMLECCVNGNQGDVSDSSTMLSPNQPMTAQRIYGQQSLPILEASREDLHHAAGTGAFQKPSTLQPDTHFIANTKSAISEQQQVGSQAMIPRNNVTQLTSRSHPAYLPKTSLNHHSSNFVGKAVSEANSGQREFMTIPESGSHCNIHQGHQCNCGEQCQCAFCLTHPWNTHTRETVLDFRNNIQNEAQSHQQSHEILSTPLIPRSTQAMESTSNPFANYVQFNYTIGPVVSGTTVTCDSVHYRPESHEGTDLSEYSQHGAVPNGTIDPSELFRYDANFAEPIESGSDEFFRHTFQ